MFKAKNLSPQKLAGFTALILSVIITLGTVLISAPWKIILIAFLLTFLVSYYLYLYTLQNFIYRKIKLIYKFIYQTKASKREEFFNKNILPLKTIEEVSEDVEKWASQKKEELDNLRRNEEFRKEFLLNLSHELKTPIFAVQGYIHTLLDGALEDPNVNKLFLKNATKNIDRLCRLIDDLDEISKLESGEMTINAENFVIQDLIKDVFDTLSLKANTKGIKFNVKKGCEAPIHVLADKEKVRQVLINLVDNSIKYGRTDGHTVASIYVMDDKRVLMEISDDGIGIAEEHLPRVFERFYRTDRARSRDIGGTGLGLAIVKHIIEAHGQTINIRSKPEIGSTFGFTLESGE
ncbi:two-component system, OmpR family, phosphate regulon sensor histidine kinase PhoR [Chitinophaga sp. YR627]|uniref:sensor histidine kinase n=1 Tax=Chitinophaga sp. YR627 TaxID=1881041 RepID=UPI0008E61587|nr:ATP-binding protein [Chitinophaga sp. YR627]SFN97143.1 two-component system, OmpR family, phosphate regulon sensor histidine kinase PhoR [Chitinophaga sp. YR627]